MIHSTCALSTFWSCCGSRNFWYPVFFFWLPQCFVIRIVAKSVASHVWHSWKGKQIKTNTPPKFNINPEKLPSQRESSLTTFFPFFPPQTTARVWPDYLIAGCWQDAICQVGCCCLAVINCTPRKQEATRDTVYLYIYIIVHCTYYVFFLSEGRLR